jgi:hypothetical protein
MDVYRGKIIVLAKSLDIFIIVDTIEIDTFVAMNSIF